jgi:hypothetical protein
MADEHAQKDSKANLDCYEALTGVQTELLDTVNELFMLKMHFDNCDPHVADKNELGYLLTFMDGAVSRAFDAVEKALGYTYRVVPVAPR